MNTWWLKMSPTKVSLVDSMIIPRISRVDSMVQTRGLCFVWPQRLAFNICQQWAHPSFFVIPAKNNCECMRQSPNEWYLLVVLTILKNISQ